VIHKNLTPFYWGPKATSRQPPQVEMAICVRAAFRLAPGQPLEAIEDPIDQGFMSGDVFDPEDVDMVGPLRHASDFVDWKPRCDVLLKGAAYPPKGGDVVCDVRFGVGYWSKTLRVFGPRAYKPGVLFGGGASAPEPFTHCPLTWENAYGGHGYERNPAGKGYATAELPRVEYPDRPVKKQGQRGVVPAGFGPISPQWPQRQAKLGEKWGAAWEKKRKPFYAEDFDWTYFNAAPEDQQLEQFLNGDEQLVFENLHPQAPSFSVRLPGLRIRALVRGHDDAVHDRKLLLDTLYADLDAGRLYLTWRGHVPVRELDLTDVKSALIASEPLLELPRPTEHYRRILEEFEDDPIGLQAKLPPGFMEVAQAVEAAEAAEMNGEPMPDLKKVAENLPAGCPFPPWFLAAVAGDPDPLGIMDGFPKELLDEADPIGVKAAAGPLADVDPKRVTNALGAAQGRPPKELPDALEAAAKELPEKEAQSLRDAAAEVRRSLTDAEQGRPEVAEALAKPPPQPTEPQPSAAEQLEGAKAQTRAELDGLEARIRDLPPDQQGDALAKVQSGKAGVAGVPTLDDMVAKALAPLDRVELPPAPEIPDVEGQLAQMKQQLVADEAKLRGRGIDHPLLGLFAMGHRLIDKAPRPGVVEPPDMSGLMGGLQGAKDQLLAAGVGLTALKPLTGLTDRLGDLMAKLPQPKRPPKRDYAYQDLRGQDLSGQSLASLSFARADLTKANLRGADLKGADLSEAVLKKADLSEADLTGAKLDQADLEGALLAGARLEKASLRQAKLLKVTGPGVHLAEADLEGADLQKASLPAALATGANLTDAWIAEADLSGARLRGARLEQCHGAKAKLAKADLREADCRFAELTKADLREADLSGADLSIADLSKVRGDGLKLVGVKFDMGQLTKARLHGADLQGARSGMGSLEGSDLRGADMRRVVFEKVDMSGTVLDGVDFSEARLEQCMLRGAQASEARFVRADLTRSHATGKAAFRRCNFALLRGTRTVWMDADLTGSDFSYARLKDAFLQGARGEDVNWFAANLKGASLRKVDLSRCRFVRCDLAGADVTESKLVDVQFTGANCWNAKFVGAALAGCDFLEANLDSSHFDRAEGAPQR